MAKKRRLSRQHVAAAESMSQAHAAKTSASGSATDRSALDRSATERLANGQLPMMLSAALMGGTIVYVSYHPSDSVAVENGDALWFSVIAVLLAGVTWGWSLWTSGYRVAEEDHGWIGVAIDAIPWALAAWMMLAAVATAPPGNLRLATNEAWLWVAGACVLTASRRVMASPEAQSACLLLVMVCASALAVHTLHQQYISLPADRQAYREDPDEVIRLAGIDAPPGSAERMVFESRLLDGGPTGTFALANSLAGVLVVGTIVMLGVLGFSWRDSSWLSRCVLAAAMALCALGLLYVRSRSAILAAMLGAVVSGVLFLWPREASERFRAISSLIMKATAVFFAALVLVVLALDKFAAAEWIGQARASMEFRLQYWRSTVAMVLDRPIFGAGPGNFQSIYLQYREDSASEQIAEPHNFLIETMSSGGIPALLLVLGLLVLIARHAFSGHSTSVAQCDQVQPSTLPDEGWAGWVWLGASVSFVLVWMLGYATGRVPDFSAQRFAIPTAVACGVAIWPAVRALDQRKRKMIGATTLLALLVHLLASGGWTIPGVAIYVWIFAALVTLIPAVSSQQDLSAGSRQLALVAFVGGFLMLALLHLVSLGPVQRAQVAVAEFEFAQRSGHMRQAELALGQAAQADRWSSPVAVWQADLLHWQLVQQGDSGQLRRRWERAVEHAKQLAGQAPSAWEVLGRQQLHLFQRYGVKEDLVAAGETFRKVVHWNPADQHAVAQWAAIADSLGQTVEAEKLARRAFYLSKLGNNIERDLQRQLIHVPQQQGSEAAQRAVLSPAAELLSNHLQ